MAGRRGPWRPLCPLFIVGCALGATAVINAAQRGRRRPVAEHRSAGDVTRRGWHMVVTQLSRAKALGGFVFFAGCAAVFTWLRPDDGSRFAVLWSPAFWPIRLALIAGSLDFVLGYAVALARAPLSQPAVEANPIDLTWLFFWKNTVSLRSIKGVELQSQYIVLDLAVAKKRRISTTLFREEEGAKTLLFYLEAHGG